MLKVNNKYTHRDTSFNKHTKDAPFNPELEKYPINYLSAIDTLKLNSKEADSQRQPKIKQKGRKQRKRSRVNTFQNLLEYDRKVIWLQDSYGKP